MKQSFGSFKEHALDLAITATKEPAIGSEQVAIWQRVSRKTEWRKLIQLPVAALYAVLTLVCMVTFAVIYYPKLYVPVLYEKAKAKFVEYEVADHAAKLKEKSTEVYKVARDSELAAKGSEYLEKGATHVSEMCERANVAITNSAVANAIVENSAAATSAIRSKVASELVKLKGDDSLEVRAESSV